jgi:uncharacterized protein YlbG (UPF0298 family)
MDKTADWVKVTNEVPQGSILGPLLFIIHINDLPKIVESNSVPILFADDASVLISHANPLQFKNIINVVYGILDDWFVKNPLSLNKVKTRCINFTAKNNMQMVRDLAKFGTFITTSKDIKFLGLIIENSLPWEGHIEEVIKKLSTACYMLRNIKPFVSRNILKIIHYSYFQSVMTYGLMYWGSSSSVDRVFRMQKGAV